MTHATQDAEAYLGSLSVAERRLNGQVYTPDRLVDFILDLSGYISGPELETAAILDPACGGGAFLSAAVNRIASGMVSRGENLSSEAGRRSFLKTVERNVFGVDVDPHACAIARKAVRAVVVAASPGRLPNGFFTRNVIKADFLLDDVVAHLPAVGERRLQFIVGNPPYVSATRIKNDYKDLLRSRFSTARGRLDLYTVFFERSLTMLADGGKLGFITPDKFLLSQTARDLRGLLLAAGAVRVIARFSSHRIFEDAATVPCITVVEKSRRPNGVQVLECGERRGKEGNIQVLSRSRLDQARLSDSPWSLVAPDLGDLACRLQHGHPTLAERTSRISAGPATGLDRVYVQATAQHEVEAELLRPAARGRDLQPFAITDSGLSVLLPYTFDKAGTPHLVEIERYPRAFKYLARYRSELEARHCVRVWEKAWFDLHDQVLVDLARLPKILVPDVADSNRFAFDEGRYLPLHSAYYLIPRADTDPRYMTAVLNSRVAEFLIRLNAPVVKDGFSRYRRQFLATLPIPEAPEREQRAIIDAASNGDTARTNQLVAELFQVREVDALRIERYLTSGRASAAR